MSEQEQHRTKKEEDEDYLKSCQKCTKFFTNQQAYETHIKMKHDQKKNINEQQADPQQEEDGEDSEANDSRSHRRGNKSVPVRSRMLEIQRNELEDNIYTFLGELGQKNVQPISSRAQIINFANDQKLTGQTNYSVNKVIRTPYQEPIKCSDEIPKEDFDKSKHKDFLEQLKVQLQKLEAKIEQEKQTWELRDPMAPEEEVADEFSLMDIKKLIQNYPKRKVDIAHPHFSIFLLWLGRICKSPAFKQFYLILGEYLADYLSTETSKIKGEQAYEIWREHYKKFDQKKLEAQTLQRLKIFDEKNARRFIEFFVNWTDTFRALNI